MAGRRAGQLRIIGGTWRSRLLRIAPVNGLRPTSDRARETLFNWLSPRIEGARCLDLFAGSGALGIEALSRGASHVMFVERDARVRRELADNLHRLGPPPNGEWRISPLAAKQFLSRLPAPFDIVFLDPPFGQGLIGSMCEALSRDGWLSAGARVYLEHEPGHDLPALPAGWTALRQGRTGQVRFQLIGVDPVDSP